MIFDWAENSKRVLEAHRLSDRDSWERKRMWGQELAFMRYAIHSLGWNVREARSFWDGIPNGWSAALSHDRETADAMFSRLWWAALNMGPLPPVLPGAITQGDVDYLGSLQAPAEVRRLWMAEALWIRSCEASGIPAAFDVERESWLWRAIGAKRPYKKAHASIQFPAYGLST